MSTRVQFKSKSGVESSGYMSEPTGASKGTGKGGKTGAIVLIQEWWGVNDYMQSLVDRLASEGFITLAPDLYHGKVTTDSNEASALMHALDWAQATDEITGAAQFLKAHERCNGHVAVMGFCLGGALSFAAACAIPDLAAAVPFYGVPSKVDFSKITAPIQAHFAAHDEWAKPSAAKSIQDELAAHGKPMELHVYDAQHAFMNETRKEVYNEPAAKLAWTRALDFLRKALGNI